MGILAWIIFGLIAGAIARLLMPGEQPLGIIGTCLLGIGGSIVGGLLASVLLGANPSGFQTSGLIGSVLGAVILLFLFQRFGRGGGTSG